MGSFGAGQEGEACSRARVYSRAVGRAQRLHLWWETSGSQAPPGCGVEGKESHRAGPISSKGQSGCPDLGVSWVRRFLCHGMGPDMFHGVWSEY